MGSTANCTTSPASEDLQIFRGAGVTAGRLARQLRERAIIDVVLYVLTVGNERKGSYPHNLGFLTLTIQLHDGSREPGHFAGFDHFPLQLEPQGLHLIDGCQLAGGTHLGSQVTQPLTTIGKLSGDDGAFEHAPSIAGDLLKHAKQLAQGSKTTVELLLQIANADFVFFKLGFESLRALFLPAPLGARIIQHALLPGFLASEFLLASRMLARLRYPALIHEPKQLI